MERFHFSIVNKTVSHPADGIQVPRGPAEFLAEPAHMSVHRSRVDKIVVLPDIAEQLLTRLHSSAALCQQGEKLKFCGGQLDAFSLHGYKVLRNINTELIDANELLL